MLVEGLRDVPSLGMHLYILVQTSSGHFAIYFSVQTQLIGKHNNLSIYQEYTWYTLYIPCIYRPGCDISMISHNSCNLLDLSNDYSYGCNGSMISYIIDDIIEP